jgi:hypothetical protein
VGSYNRGLPGFHLFPVLPVKQDPKKKKEKDKMMIIPSFAPFEIDRSTFSTLLACYPTATREGFRRKILAKAQRKADREERKKAKKKSSAKGSTTVAADGDDSKAELPIPKGRLDHETDVFLKLDSWRYETLPATLKERAAKSQNQPVGNGAKSDSSNPGGSTGFYMEKDELVKLMEWKLYVFHVTPVLRMSTFFFP